MPTAALSKKKKKKAPRKAPQAKNPLKISRAESRRRLLKLAAKLDEIGLDPKLDEAFDMCSWAVGATKPFQQPNTRFRLDQALNCNTAGCACGWATAIPEFRKLGLFLRTMDIPVVEGDIGSAAVCYQPTPGRIVYDGTRAAAKFFGISELDASYLFTSDSTMKNSALEEAAEIRRYVREHLSEDLD